MRDLDYSDLQKHVDIMFDFGTCAPDFDDIGGRVLNKLIKRRDNRRS